MTAMKKLKVALFTFIAFMQLAAAGDEKSPAYVPFLMLKMAQNSPDICLGYEIVRDLKIDLVGDDAIAGATRDWASLTKAVAAQTDYQIITEGLNVLLIPKPEPDRDDAPISRRKIEAVQDINSWQTAGDALNHITFFDPENIVKIHFTENESFSMENKLNFQNKLLQTGNKFSKDTAIKEIHLADALFILARALGARQWLYQPYRVPSVNEKSTAPRKLEFSTLQFDK